MQVKSKQKFSAWEKNNKFLKKIKGTPPMKPRDCKRRPPGNILNAVLSSTTCTCSFGDQQVQTFKCGHWKKKNAYHILKEIQSISVVLIKVANILLCKLPLQHLAGQRPSFSLSEIIISARGHCLSSWSGQWSVDIFGRHVEETMYPKKLYEHYSIIAYY